MFFHILYHKCTFSFHIWPSLTLFHKSKINLFQRYIVDKHLSGTYFNNSESYSSITFHTHCHMRTNLFWFNCMETSSILFHSDNLEAYWCYKEDTFQDGTKHRTFHEYSGHSFVFHSILHKNEEEQEENTKVHRTFCKSKNT